MTGPGSNPLQRVHQEGLGGGGPMYGRRQICLQSRLHPSLGSTWNKTHLSWPLLKSVLLCPFAAATLALCMVCDPAKLFHALGPWQSFYPQLECSASKFLHTGFLSVRLHSAQIVTSPTTLSHPHRLSSHHPALFSCSVFNLCDDLVHVFVCLSVTPLRI